MEASCFVAVLLAVLALFRCRPSRRWRPSRALLGLALAMAAACTGARGSVGAILGKDVHDGRLYVREVPPGLSAAVAGIRDGDEVIAIDGVPVGDMSPAEVHKRLEGDVGTKVVLLLVRGGETKR